MLLELAQANFDGSQGPAAWMVFFVVYVLSGLLPLLALIYLVYFFTTLPMRRNERARLFLNLLEHGLKLGRTPERAIVEASSSRDRSLSVRFHLLAAYLEQGVRLSQGLERVRHFLPPRVSAMLKTGERIGDISKVLPACRYLLQDAVSHVRAALNYLILLVFVVTPFAAVVPLFLRIKVMPAYQQVFAGMMEGGQLPFLTRFVLGGGWLLAGIQLGSVFFLWALMFAYLAGPRWRLLPQRWSDAISWRLPWRRRRLLRDFSAMLAILLEANVPEAEAVALAASSCGNLVLIARAANVVDLLQKGIPLPQATESLDSRGELRWRLANALRTGTGFLRSLAGWHDYLDAKAFQSEQAAAQITSTALVLINGAVVGSIVIGLFLGLVHLLNAATLW